MPYQMNTEAANSLATEVLALPFFKDAPAAGVALNAPQANMMQGSAEQTLWIHEPSNFKASSVLLIGCGEKKSFDYDAFAAFIKTLALSVKTANATKLAVELPAIAGKSEAWIITQFILNFESHLYTFNRYKTKQEKPAVDITVTFLVKEKSQALEQALKTGTAINTGIHLTRDLGNTPPNDCQPIHLTAAARELQKQHPKLKVDVLDEAAMLKLGMGAFMAVSQGSDAEGQMVFMHFNNAPTKDSAPIVLIGKGITFDTGGYCIKQREPMFGMRYDMCGAATVIGVIQACIALDLPIHVIGVVAAAENMISGNAYRPSDVIKTYAGLTVEITNTDAEGRLVLCDALAYCQQFKPACMIDVATLTGAAITALGHRITALMSNNRPLTDALLAASRDREDPTWELPLDRHFDALLKSSHGDLKNAVLSGEAGSITAACFLAHFVGTTPWAHLDIAGTAVSKDASSATGRPVALLTQFLIDQTHAKN